MPTHESTLQELSTTAAPAPRPQPMTFHEGKLWLGCLGTPKLFALDPQTLTVISEVALPGAPYGVASFGGELHVVISIGEDDDRYIHRFSPDKPNAEASRIPCPDLTGSHLTTDGKALYLVQQSNRRMLKLAPDGSVAREISLAQRCAGAAFGDGACHLITADEDFDVLEIAKFDVDDANATPIVLSSMHIEARGLAYDGKSWWTCYRELGRIVSFKI